MRRGWSVREETKARLDALMVRYEKRLVELHKRHELTRKQNDVFIGEFEQLIDGTIRPALEDVGAALRTHGHEYEISGTQGYTDFGGRMRSTQITMRVYPSGIQRSLFTSTSTPYVAFACDWLDKRVTVLESTVTPLVGSKATSGKSGKRGAFEIKQLTQPVIEREIVDVLAGVFGRERVPYPR